MKKSTSQALAPDEQEILQVEANTGMNGVVPAWRLLELLNLPKFKDPRDRSEAAERERRKRATPGAALHSATEEISAASDENLKHREDFDRLLDKASRPQKD